MWKTRAEPALIFPIRPEKPAISPGFAHGNLWKTGVE